MKNKAKITFYGGAGTVTGANFLLEVEGKKILVDCGMIQGAEECEDKVCHDENRKPFEYDPKEIDVLFITHAHIDHIGLVPKLIRAGFKGKIYSTIPTKDLSAVMLDDAAGILENDADHRDEKPLYTKEDVHKSMEVWQGFEYKEAIELFEGIEFTFFDAGHVLGSAMIRFTVNGKNIYFTGDLGNSPSPLLCDPEKISDADYVVMESVYGDRNHEVKDLRRKKFKELIKKAEKNDSVLMIPLFSLEKTQEVLFELNNMVEGGEVPEVPIFLDSPLAIRLTDVYKRHKKYLNEETKKVDKKDDDIFDFPGLNLTMETDESKAIPQSPNPKIILAGSGMSNGGRIIHHERDFLPDSNNILLLIGYQAVGTLGRHLQEGADKAKFFGEEVPIRANIEQISGYSAHMESDSLVDFVSSFSDRVKKVYVAMGEPKASMFLAQRLKDELDVRAIVPKANDVAELDI